MQDFQDFDNTQKPKKQYGFGTILFAAVISALIGVLLSCLLIPPILGLNTADGNAGTSPAPTTSSSLGSNIPPTISADNPVVDIAEQVTPSVVSITGKRKQMVNGTIREQDYSSGSGIILTEDGYIATNSHVIESADVVYVTLSGGQELTAEVIGQDSSSDLAVLKIARDNLPAATLGSSSSLKVGEMVVAIGDPFGANLASTVTVGFISALDRKINMDGTTYTLLQTDAAINPGNSGGALVNSRGEVIGINTLKSRIAGYDQFGNAISAEGIGFAIPIDQAKPILDALIQDGKIDRPGIGIKIYTVTEQDSQSWNVPQGVMVSQVIANSPAEKAGLKKDDIITALNGQKVLTTEDFLPIVQGSTIGDTITLSIYREGKTFDVDVKIASMNDISY